VAALSANDPGFQPGFTEADTTIQAAALLYGVYDLTALNDDGQPRLRDYARRCCSTPTCSTTRTPARRLTIWRVASTRRRCSSSTATGRDRVGHQARNFAEPPGR